VKAVPIDYNKPESLKEALKNVDKLFLLTPDVPTAHELASNLVNEAKKAGVKYIVKQSVMGADEDADVGTMRLHRRAEKTIEESGMPYTFLRPNEFMQNFINFHGHSIKNNNVFYIPAQEAKVSIVDVRDIAAVAVEALTDNNGNVIHKNKAHLITGPEAISYYQAADILTTETGKKIDYVSISDEDARGGMKEMNMNDWLINTILELYNYYRKGNASYVSSAVKEVTGRKPITFAQFAKDYAETFR
ncbi:MAG: SDR family oxidoreductase, partial [Nitrososphaeraceae archaeon]